MCWRLCQCLKGAGCCGCIVSAAFVPLAVFVAAILEEPRVVSVSASEGMQASMQRDGGDVLCERPWNCHSQVPDGGSARTFDRLALAYDKANRLMSLGLDQVWRQKLVQECLQPFASDQILDLAAGTVDVGLLVAEHLEAAGSSTASIKGVDPSRRMLEQGVSKANESSLHDYLHLYHGYAEDLSSLRKADSPTLEADSTSIADESVDKIAIAFGIRHISNLKQALKEIHRVLRRPSGRLCILDSSLSPDEGLLPDIMRQAATSVSYFVRRVAAAIPSWRQADSEMFDDILHFPTPLEFAGLLAREGLPVQKITSFAFGTVHLYQAAPMALT